MGAANYRSKAKTDAEKEFFEKCGFTCGAVSMCGWRRTNEDAHLVKLEFEKGLHLFGVFDGHGGRAVAKCVAAKLPDLLRENEWFKKKNYAEAMRTVFMQMDEYLASEDGRDKLIEYDIPGSDEDPDDDQLDINQLLEDPEMMSQLGPLGLAAMMGKKGDEEEDDDEDDEEADEASEESEKAKEAEKPETTETTASEPQEVESKAEAKEDAKEDESKEPAKEDAEKEEGEKAEKKEGEESSDSDDSDFDPDAEYPDDEFEDDDDMPPELPTPEDQGCTAVLALLDFTNESSKTLYVANAGDSRAILAKDADAVAMSHDHKPSLPEETARIEAAGSTVTTESGDFRVNGELNLSRAIGDLRFKQNTKVKKELQAVTADPDIKTMQLHSECKFLVLACDGIFEKYENEEVINRIREGVNEADTAEKLCDVAHEFMLHNVAKDPADNEGLGCDNMSMLICKLPTDQMPDINSMRETRPRKVARLA